MLNNPPNPMAHQGPPLVLSPDLPLEYVNLVRIAHSPSELVFDFANMLPGAETAPITSRIIMSPMGAKLFLHALTENLARYEAAFGEIKIPGGASLAENLFRSHNPDE